MRLQTPRSNRRNRLFAATMASVLCGHFLPIAQAASLRELALESPNKQVVVYLEPDSEETFIDLYELSQFSDAAVIGSVQSNACVLSADQETVYTDFRFAVEKTLWGSVRQGSGIVVRLPGGKVVFPEGVSAEVAAGWFKKPEPGRRYLLLLQARDRTSVDPPSPRLRWAGADSTAADFSLTGGPQGLFELGGDGKIHVSSGRKDDPVWSYRDMPIGDFLSLLDYSAQAPHPPASLLVGDGDQDGQTFSRLFPFHQPGVRLDLVSLETAAKEFRNRAGEVTFSTGVLPGTPARMEGDNRSELEVEAASADLAVVGVIRSRESFLTHNREFVFSVYRLEVEETLKSGSRQPVLAGSTIQVVAPGGRVRVNGVFVRADDAALKPFQVGSRCLLLLKTIPSTEACMAQANGSFQLFSDHVSVLRWGQALRDLVDGKTPEEFVQEVRGAVAQIGFQDE